MKIGSLVLCIRSVDDNSGNPVRVYLPIAGKIYTVRDIVINPRNGDHYLRLVEIVNPLRQCRGTGKIGEVAFNHAHFREIEPAELSELTEILEAELV